ncbi:hypothetical protein QUF61_12090 [Candidatus Venteria ishoeyi]|uniref:LPS-assembly lipoprotein LptE n=1 Tax=Candidatus Venteria ishoeyi TaxID=1899563 RepID=UPI0025A598C1|nr:LPS assembly lipoprotein LptE [Candidatus Venteria ishoeyi]MDM8547227.1 hypothetical protein [Candidatus Venteria ishoeyi]
MFKSYLTIQYTLLCGLLLLLTACGFQLRGEVKLPETLQPIYVASQNADLLAAMTRLRLQEHAVAMTQTPDQAGLLLTLSQESQEERTFTVSALSGKLQEVELHYRVALQVKDSNGKLWIPAETIHLQRTFAFDEQAVLAKYSERQVLIEEMRHDIVSQVLRRLSYLTE